MMGHVSGMGTRGIGHRHEETRNWSAGFLFFNAHWLLFIALMAVVGSQKLIRTALVSIRLEIV